MTTLKLSKHARAKIAGKSTSQPRKKASAHIAPKDMRYKNPGACGAKAAKARGDDLEYRKFRTGMSYAEAHRILAQCVKDGTRSPFGRHGVLGYMREYKQTMFREMKESDELAATQEAAYKALIACGYAPDDAMETVLRGTAEAVLEEIGDVPF